MWAGRRGHNYHPQIHFPTNPAVLAVRKHKDSSEIEHLTLHTLITTRCKGLSREFKRHWWLFNGHLQTIYGEIADFSKCDLMWYNRQYLRLADGGTLGLDFAPLNASHLLDDSPIVVVLLGLTGGPHEPYARAILSRICASVEHGGLGYRAVIINFRGCAGVPLTSPEFHCPGNTDDLRQALYYISSRYPKARLLGLGFSVGANDMTRYLAEEGNQTRIHAACVLACPWDFATNNIYLTETFLGKHLYAKALGRNLLKLLKRHSQIVLREPRFAEACVRTLKLKRPTIDEFHNVFTRIVGRPAPYFPFETTQQYYQWGSSHEVVGDVKVPFLAINAYDDPVVRHVPIHGGGNGLVVMALTSGGGHLGWFQSGPDSRFERWTTQPVLEWLKLVGEELIDDPEIKQKNLYFDDDGFLREDGRQSIGCKPIEGGGVINGNNGADGIFLDS